MKLSDLHQSPATRDREALEPRIRAMAAQGIGEHEIAALTGLHLRQVRRILASTPQRIEE